MRTRQLLGVLAIAQLFCVAPTARAVDRTLEIYVENAADPFSRPDGSGYANDVVRAAFEAVGVRVNFKVVPYTRCKYKVLSGEASACVRMSWDPSFEGRIRFADTPLINVTPVYYENRARPLAAHLQGCRAISRAWSDRTKLSSETYICHAFPPTRVVKSCRISPSPQ